MWFVCYDKETNEVRRVIELSSQAKADAIKKYRMSEAFLKKPDVEVIPELASVPKTAKEYALETLGLTESDLTNIKKIDGIDTRVKAIEDKEIK